MGKGANSENKTMKMAVPVGIGMQYSLKTHNVSSVLSFYIPTAKNTPAPTPTDPKVKIKQAEKFCVYVRAFPGYVMGRSRLMYKQLYLLSKAIRKDKGQYAIGRSVYAGYNSPWQRRHRHNEVWRFPHK